MALIRSRRCAPTAPSKRGAMGLVPAGRAGRHPAEGCAEAVQALHVVGQADQISLHRHLLMAAQGKAAESPRAAKDRRSTPCAAGAAKTSLLRLSTPLDGSPANHRRVNEYSEKEKERAPKPCRVSGHKPGNNLLSRDLTSYYHQLLGA